MRTSRGRLEAPKEEEERGCGWRGSLRLLALEPLTHLPPRKATLTHNLAVAVQLHGGAVCCQATGGGQSKGLVGVKAPQDTLHQPPTSLRHPLHAPADTPRGPTLWDT